MTHGQGQELKGGQYLASRLSALIVVVVDSPFLDVGIFQTLIASSIELLEAVDHLFEMLLPVLSEPRNLQDVTGSHVVDILALLAEVGNGTGGHCKAHVFGTVDKLQDGGWGLVFLQRLDAEDASVATGTVSIAFADWAEKSGDKCVWFL